PTLLPSVHPYTSLFRSLGIYRRRTTYCHGGYAPVALPRELLGLRRTMGSIDTYNACVDFPIFDAKSRSLKKAVLSTAGGAIGQNDDNVVGVEALKDINLQQREGDRIGLVGHHGDGNYTK